MTNNVTELRKMKPFVIVRPRKRREIIVFLLMIIVIAASVSPIINAVNIPLLVLGMPLMMLWAILIVIAVTVVLIIAVKWEVY